MKIHIGSVLIGGVAAIMTVVTLACSKAAVDLTNENRELKGKLSEGNEA